VPLLDGAVWYQANGIDLPAVPLLVVHGGPGYPRYLDNLDAVTATYSRPTIFYDQLGSGNSDRPNDNSLWTLNRSVFELDSVIESMKKKFGISRLHLLGHSTGASIVAQYLADKRPDDIASGVLSSPLLSTEMFVDDVNDLIDKLPDADAFKKDVAAYQIDDTEGTPVYDAYMQRVAQFENKHTYGEIGTNHPLKHAADVAFGEAPYTTMWGTSEFLPTGNLLGFDVTGRLGELGRPILYTAGQFDEVQPRTAYKFWEMTPNSEVVIFPNSAHMANLDEPQRYIYTV
jgi:proline iminopeptidase